MLMLEPASERVNFLLGHSLVLAQLKTSYIELDMRLMSTLVLVVVVVLVVQGARTQSVVVVVLVWILFGFYFFVRHRNNGNGNRKSRTHVTRGKEKKNQRERKPIDEIYGGNFEWTFFFVGEKHIQSESFEKG